jgi:hypothetical protein
MQGSASLLVRQLFLSGRRPTGSCKIGSRSVVTVAHGLPRCLALKAAHASNGEERNQFQTAEILLQRARSAQILTGAVKFKNLDEASLVSGSTGARVHDAVSLSSL